MSCRSAKSKAKRDLPEAVGPEIIKQLQLVI
jgi:hypothetical protein